VLAAIRASGALDETRRHAEAEAKLAVGLAQVVNGTARSTIRPPTEELEAERMVQCAHCGVNQPVSESILANDRYYCCVAATFVKPSPTAPEWSC
jgi:hypothetical protein